MFSSICRLCLENTQFLNNLKDDVLIQRVEELFNIQLEADDELPKKICNNCSTVINSFNEFKDKVDINQTKLKEDLQKAKLRFEANEENISIDFDILDKPTLPLTATKRTKSKSRNDEQITEFLNLECTMCDKIDQYESFKLLMDHYKNVHNTKGFVVCCDKKIFRKDRLLDHITNHVNPEAFKCPTCGQVSKNKVLLRIHIKQHLPEEERQFKCKLCEHKFVLKSQLTNHEASHLKEEEKKFVCDICFKAFALKFVFEKHKLTHQANNRNFLCDICTKGFSTKPNLMAHRANHNDGPGTRVRCQICQQYYKNQDTLRAHLRQHKEQQQDHICKHCEKKCSTKSSLHSHIRYVHLKVQNFSCDLCDKQFRKKVELKEHLARHSGNSLYHCPVCAKSFKSSSNYFAHRKKKHDIGKTLKSTVILKGKEDDEQIYDIEIYGETSENEVADSIF